MADADDARAPNRLQLFWDDGGGFSEAHSIGAPLVGDDQIHQYVLELPPTARGALRLDPGARPALVEIYGVELVAAAQDVATDGDVVRRWSASPGDARLTAVSGIVPLGRQGSCRFVCVDDDPQLALDGVVDRADSRRWFVRATLRTTPEIVPALIDEVRRLDRERRRRYRAAIARVERIEPSVIAPPTPHADGRRYPILHDRVLTAVRRVVDAWRALVRAEFRPRVEPRHELTWLEADDAWESIGQDPQFDVHGPWPRGWAEVTLVLDADAAVSGCARLYVDRGTGYNERDSYELGEGAGTWTQCVRLGPDVVALRLDPCASRGRFRIERLAMTAVTARRAQAAADSPRRRAPRRRPTPPPLQAGTAAPSLQSFLERTWRDDLDRFLADPTARLSCAPVSDPVVSIVIPTFDKAEYLYQCLASVLTHADVPFEVIVVDDGSRDRTAQLLDRLDHVTCVWNASNLEYLRACNRGLAHVRGRYVLFLNNDVTVTPGWLSTLVETMERDPGYGAVTGKLVRPDGTLQEAGSIVWWDGTIAAYGRNDDPAKPEYGYLREIDYGSAACLLVRAELVRQLGGFDERYRPAFYEDADLCFGVRRLGHRVAFQPRASVYHCEFGTRPGSRAQVLCRANRPKFVDKWAAELRGQHRQADLVRARDRRDGKRVLVIDDQVPAPWLGSGFPRAYGMLELLAQSGFVITFVPVTCGTAHQPATERLQQLGIEVCYGDGFPLDDLLRERAGAYDVVLVSRPHNGARLLPLARRYFPRATIVYDAEALFCLREFRQAELAGRPVSEDEQRRRLREELDIMKPADVVITVSASERDVIVKEQAHPHVVVWGHARAVHSPVTPFADRRDLLFVGGFAGGHPPNTDAVSHFAAVLFPRIRSRLPGARFVIVGNDPPEAVRSLAGPDVVVAGFVEDLVEHYERSRVFVAPVRFGAGISLKLLEAMSYGLPAVVSPVGASGLDLRDGGEVLIAESDDQFIDKTVRLYQDERLWTAVQDAAAGYVRRQCAPDVMRARLVEALSNPA